MFERYTESARRTLFFARYEASEFGSMSIETEHILLGLVREGKGIVAHVLPPPIADASRDEIHRRVARREKIATSIEIPFSEQTKLVLQHAAREADDLRHGYIGPEHLLLGLMREDESVAGSVLLGQGLRLPAVRASILRVTGELAEPDRSQDDTWMLLNEEPVDRGTSPDDVEETIVMIKHLLDRLTDPVSSQESRKQLATGISRALDEIARAFRSR